MKNFEEKEIKDLSSVIGGETEGLVVKFTEHNNENGTIIKLDIYWQKK
jgi:hypothetical protein